MSDHGLAHFVVQAIGREHEHVAGLEGEGSGVRRDEHFRAQGTNEDMARIGVGDFVGGDEAHFALLVDRGCGPG